MSKLSKSEAGKLGAIKSTLTIKLAMEERIKNYRLNSSLCKECNSSLVYEKRKYSFCCSACSASYNNKLRIKKNKSWKCKNCSKEHHSMNGKIGIYCDSTCQKEYQYSIFISDWLSGKNSGTIGKLNALSGYIKKYIKKKYNYTCTKCKNDSWLGIPITLEVEHIDGNGENNIESNLTVLCPNCHSQTATFKGKNRGNGRKNRYGQKEVSM
jgi:hypothetical protein